MKNKILLLLCLIIFPCSICYSDIEYIPSSKLSLSGGTVTGNLTVTGTQGANKYLLNYGTYTYHPMYVLESKDVNASMSGTVSTILYSTTVPGGLMGINDKIELIGEYTFTDNTQGKSVNCSVAGIDLFGYSASAATVFIQNRALLQNSGSTTANISHLGWIAWANAQTTNAINARTIDTRQDISIQFKANMSAGNGTCTLRLIQINLYKNPN